MKALASSVIFAVLFGCVHGQAMIGTCTIPQYLEKIQPCQTKFIHDLQKNPKSDCSVELQAVIKCSVNDIKSCVTGMGMSDAFLTTMLQKMMTKDVMCNKAGLQFPGSMSSMGGNNTLPCNITEAQYTSKINSCRNKLLTMWQANKADPETCMEYKMTKACVSKVIQDAGCKTTGHGDFQEMLKLSLGKHNPFCSDNVDPTVTAGVTTSTSVPNGTTDASPTSLPTSRVDPTSASSQTSLSIIFVMSVELGTIFLAV